MDHKYILAVDRGQTSIKAALCHKNADIISVVSQCCQIIQSPHTGWAEQDMDRMWEDAAAAIRKLIKQSGVYPGEIAAVSFSGQGGGNFLIDKDGRPVRSGILSMDSRHEEILGLIQNPENAAIPKTILVMRWLKENEPEAYKNTRWILGSKDWIRYKLTGKANADMSDTSAPVSEQGSYMTECCSIAGVSECIDMLPPLKYACEASGVISEGAAAETGLEAGTAVFVGIHDMLACMIGAGCRRQGQLTIIMGTMGINIAAVDETTVLPPVRNSGEWFTFAGMSRGQRAITSSIGSGCNTIDWFLNMFFRDTVMEAERMGISVFTYLEHLLSGQKPTNVIFQPYLLGTFYNSSAKAGFLGITSQTSREELLLAMFQGVCISMCIEIKRLETVLETFDDICIVGGGSNSTIWSQMFADVLDRPVRVCTTSEVGCRGAAICAAVALGFIKGMKDIAPPEQKHEYLPRPEMHAVYMEQYEIYSKLNESCTMMWEKQNKLNENSVKLPERNDKIKGELPC